MLLALKGLRVVWWTPTTPPRPEFAGRSQPPEAAVFHLAAGLPPFRTGATGKAADEAGRRSVSCG